MVFHHHLKRKREACSIINTTDNNGTADLGICSIRDNEEPKSLQSSLLSFFSKKEVLKSENMSCKMNPSTCISKIRKVSSPSTKKNTILTTTCSKLNNITPHLPSSKKALRQVYIDCGQSKFGQTLCGTCGMLYMPGIPEDEIQHKRMCQAFLSGIPTVRSNVKDGKQVENTSMIGRNNAVFATVVMWKPTKTIHKKLKHNVGSGSSINTSYIPSQWPLLAQMISKDLGTHEETTLDHISSHVVFLYIGTASGGSSNEKHASKSVTTRILGAVTVQMLSKAYRMISLHERSLTPEDAKLGVGLLWTHPAARHKGIATQLVNAVREHTLFGMRIAQHAIAFSSPTQAGYDFALRYCNGTNSGTNHHKHSIDHNNDVNKRDENNDVHLVKPLVYETNL